MEERTLKSSIAGSWYPGNEGDLRQTLERYLHAAIRHGTEQRQKPNILILPHAGYVYSGRTAACGAAAVAGADYQRVVLLAPSHRAYLKDTMCVPEAEAVSTPLGRIELDTEAIKQLESGYALIHSDRIHAPEHSTQIEYPFLQMVLKKFRLVPLITGEMSIAGERAAAKALRKIMDRHTLLVISSDFTHYGADFGYMPFGPHGLKQVKELDKHAFALIQKNDGTGFRTYLDEQEATICGRAGIEILLSMLNQEGGKKAEFELLHYATSADSDPDESGSRFVTYLCAEGYMDWNENETFSATEKQRLLSMARETIRQTLETGTYSLHDVEGMLTEKMRRKHGCFVTLKGKTYGELRGCIGEIEARRPLYQAVCARAVDAAFRDPRFEPLRASELDRIRIEISALSPEKAVESWKEIEIGKHGVTVSKDGREAVFLPQVAPEQGWTREEMLTQLCRKAGLEDDDWKSGAKFTVFEATVFGEDSRR